MEAGQLPLWTAAARLDERKRECCVVEDEE